MAKVKIELDLDWIGEDGDVDQHIKDEVISSLQSNFTMKAEQRLDKMLNDKLHEVATKVTDEFLAKIMSEKIENVMIPHKSNDWRSDVEMLTVSEFVGRRYERFLKEKVLTKHGEIASYSRDAEYSIHEYFTRNFLEKELVGKVNKLIANARQEAEQTVIKTLEDNLRAQLSADLINRLNIPSMLKSLQEKAAMLEGSDE